MSFSAHLSTKSTSISLSVSDGNGVITADADGRETRRFWFPADRLAVTQWAESVTPDNFERTLVYGAIDFFESALRAAGVQNG